jgi:hypothetical protein
VLSGVNSYTLPTASATVLGGIKVGANLSISSGVLAGAAPYSKPSAEPISYITGLQGALDAKTTPGYVDTQVAALVDSAPGTLDTLNELAEALGDDPNHVTTMTALIGDRLPKAGGAMTGGITSSSDITVGNAYISSGYSQFANLRVPNNGYFGNPSNVGMIQLQGSGQTLFNGNIAVTGTVDGIDIAARDAILTSTTTTANNALPKSGGSMTGDLQIGTDNVAGNNSGGTALHHELRVIGGNDGGVLSISHGYKAYQTGSGDLIGGLYFTDVTGGSWAAIKAKGDGQGGGSVGSPLNSNDYPGRLEFYTTPDGSGTLTERLRITSGGNVGIGTTSPSVSTSGQRVLHLHQPSAGPYSAGIHLTTADTGSGGSDGAFIELDGNDELAIRHQENKRIAFATNNTERMTIQNTGKVGIGTVTPSALLHIKGTNEVVLKIENQTKTYGFRNQTSGVFGLFDYTGNDWIWTTEDFGKNDGTSALPFDSAWESMELGYSSGNYYVMIGGIKRHVYINNSQYDGAWILVTRARNNSTCHHATGGSGGDTSPINPTGSCHSYSDSFINDIINANVYAGSNNNCAWWAYADNAGTKTIFGFKDKISGNPFQSSTLADGRGWDWINTSYSNSANHNSCGNDGSRGFGDHHCSGSFYAYNRHNSNAGFSRDGMSDSDGVFYIRN